MEEILQKSVIHERYFNRLSPDFIPISPLRMEMRRNLFKDTRRNSSNSGILQSGCWQRKSIKRSRDCYKFNKEIAKIRNSYSNMDLKNKVMLKYVESLKPKALSNKDKSLISGNKKENEEEKDHFLDELTKDMNNMVIECDSDFKINNKIQKPDKSCPKPLRIKNNNVPHISEQEAKENHDFSDVLRIECTYFNDTQNVQVLVSGNVSEHDEQAIENSYNTDQNYTLGGDLQSLLMMMALTPKSNNSDEISKTKSPLYFVEDHCFDKTDNRNERTNFEYHNHDKPMYSDDQFNENFTNALSIRPMRIKISSREEALLRKYVEKWRDYVKIKKEEFSRQRQVVLDSFFDRLAKKKGDVDNCHESVKKAKLLALDYNTYQRRYKLQKHIIALQRAKLEEQNRMIEELKYNKIIEASRRSVDEVREEVRKAYFEIDRQLKPKLKTITKDLKLNEIEEPSLVLHCLKVPQFLKRMEKRAREREEKHAMIRERRKQMEEERIRLKQQAEIAKAEMDKEEKLRRLKEMKEKRKREKIECIRKKQYAARLRALIVMADLHYEKTLKINYGIIPFKKLLAIRRDNIEKAKAHYVFQLKNNVFLNWMWYTEDMWFERNFKADDFYRKKLLKKGFIALIKNKYQYVLQKQVADDYYELYVTQLTCHMRTKTKKWRRRKFREGIEVLRKENEIKMKRAIAYHNTSLVFKAFTCWRTLPALNALKREQDARKARWREKVLQVVPDYVPPEE